MKSTHTYVERAVEEAHFRPHVDLKQILCQLSKLVCMLKLFYMLSILHL